jgi:uncharacterized Zn finger protein
MRYYGFPEYVSVAEKRAKAERKLKLLKKKNPDMRPVIIQGHALANTWWGKEWNKNLERYADYSNRIGRGRSYVRHGAVLDLKITPGRVDALVEGSHAQPYRVSIIIKPIPKKDWTAVKTACKGKLESLQTLISGKFPKDLADLFTRKGGGLFPSPREISLGCSCPDWATMCKHVAAVLYGIGTRLDDDPNLFFILRNADSRDLVSEAIVESRNDLLKKAKRKTSRILDGGADLSDMFGIDLESDDSVMDSPLPKTEGVKKGGLRKKELKKPQVSTSKPRAGEADALTQIEALIKKRKSGIKVADIITITGLDAVKVRNSIARMKHLDRIESVAWGIYKIR